VSGTKGRESGEEREGRDERDGDEVIVCGRPDGYLGFGEEDHPCDQVKGEG
jgi:hypothetical protein